MDWTLLWMIHFRRQVLGELVSRFASTPIGLVGPPFALHHSDDPVPMLLYERPIPWRTKRLLLLWLMSLRELLLPEET